MSGLTFQLDIRSCALCMEQQNWRHGQVPACQHPVILLAILIIYLTPYATPDAYAKDRSCVCAIGYAGGVLYACPVAHDLV